MSVKAGEHRTEPKVFTAPDGEKVHLQQCPQCKTWVNGLIYEAADYGVCESCMNDGNRR